MDPTSSNRNPTSLEGDRLSLPATEAETAARLFAEEKAAKMSALQEQLRIHQEAVNSAQ